MANATFHNFFEAWRNAEEGDKLRYVGDKDRHIVKERFEALVDSEGKNYEQQHFDRQWEIVSDKIKVTIDGKEGFISKESAEELKKMLS